MKILSYLLAFLLVLISYVNTEEHKIDGETQDIQVDKSNGSNYINNKGYGDKYYGGKTPDGIDIKNNDSERIHTGSEDKGTQQIQTNRTDGSNYIYNRRYDGGRRNNEGGIYSNDSERKYGGSEEKETEEIQANRTDGSNYIYNKKHSADQYNSDRRYDEGEINNNDSEKRYGGGEEEETKAIQVNRTDGSNYVYNRRYGTSKYDGGRRHHGGEIYSNDRERRYDGREEEKETVEIQANRTDGSNYVYNRRYSGIEYDGAKIHNGGGKYSNDSEKRYGVSEEEETEAIQANRTDGSNYKYNRRYGADKYDGGRRHDGHGRHRYRNDSGRKHGRSKGEKAREILDTVKDFGNKVKDIFSRKYDSDESDGGRRHDNGGRRYGGNRRYRGSQRRGYSQQVGDSQRHNYHPRHGEGSSKTSKLNTFIEYLIPVAEFIAVVGPMLK